MSRIDVKNLALDPVRSQIELMDRQELINGYNEALDLLVEYLGEEIRIWADTTLFIYEHKAEKEKNKNSVDLNNAL
jgi:hypothetical protein